MLQRVLTALLLIPPVLAAIWFLETHWLVLIFAAFSLIGAWEWTALMKLAALPARLGYVAFIALLAAGAYAGLENSYVAQMVLVLALLWWIAAFLWVLKFPKGLPENESLIPLKAFVGMMILVPATPAIALLHGRYGPAWVLILFVIIWAADTGAYFAGRSMGKRKLAPRVSPGKTWEGFFGGVVSGALVGMAAVMVLTDTHPAVVMFGGAAAFVVMASVVGDLTESMFKRHVAIKDSGSIFPGHGGVLDRLDSLFAAAPVFVLLLQFLHR